MRKKIVWLFVGWKFLTYSFALFALYILPLQKQFTLFRDAAYKDLIHKIPYLAWIFGNFDGFFYLAIAKRGYFHSETPFFPLYPWLIRSLSYLFTIPSVLTAQLISHVAIILTLLVIKKLLVLDKKSNLFFFICILIFAYPTSFFYGSVYNDALFFLLATLTLYLARKKEFLIACAVASLATLTRLNGLALSVFIVAEYILFAKKKSIKELLTSVVLIPLAFIGYLSFVQYKFGSWNYVFSSMHVWGQDKITFPLQVVLRYLKIFFSPINTPLVFWVALFEFLFVIFYIAMIIYSYKKIRFSYWIFFVVSILIPSFTGTFQGMPRYGLHLYPFFLSLALFLEKKSFVVKSIFILVSLSLFCVYVVLFTRGYFIA